MADFPIFLSIAWVLFVFLKIPLTHWLSFFTIAMISKYNNIIRVVVLLKDNNPPNLKALLNRDPI